MTNPTWWNTKHEGSWDRIKDALKRDWEQTKHDVSKSSGRDLDQSAGDTVKQAVGKQPIPASDQPPSWNDVEPGYRFGAGAREQYGTQYPKWDAKLEDKLSRDWESLKTGSAWDHVKASVRRAWESVKH